MLVRTARSGALQDVAVRCGVKEVRYPFRRNTCILCGRCVRVCGRMWQAKAIGFVGRGLKRRVDFPFGVRPTFCKMCNSCIDLCPMTIPPCDGPFQEGEEQLCGQCESQLSMNEKTPGFCMQCEPGNAFQCSRAPE